jgi:hypothetical protein
MASGVNDPRAPKPADGVPVVHVESGPRAIAPQTRTAPGDHRVAQFLSTTVTVESLMKGQFKYDFEQARSERKEADDGGKKKTTTTKKKDEDEHKVGDASAASAAAEAEKKKKVDAAAKQATMSLERATLEQEASKTIDAIEAKITTPFVPLTTDAGTSQKRTFTKYMYLRNNKELVIDSALAADPYVKKITVMPYSASNTLVGAVLYDKKLQEEAVSFLTLMYMSPVYVCTPGLYALLHHQDKLTKENPDNTISTHPAVMDASVLYRYYRALTMAIGGFMRDNDKGKGLYDSVFKKTYQQMEQIGEVRSQRLRQKFLEIATKYSLADLTREQQNAKPLVEWTRRMHPKEGGQPGDIEKNPLRGFSDEADDAMFRMTVFYLNSMELVITTLLCVDKDTSALLCTPMVRPYMGGADTLSTKERQLCRDNTYQRLRKMAELYTHNQKRSPEMVAEGKYLLHVLEEQKAAVLTDEHVPLSIDGVSPTVFYFIRITCWLRMQKMSDQVLIHD